MLLAQSRESVETAKRVASVEVVEGEPAVEILKKAENLALLRKLADLLGGVVAVSRACVDSGWISAAHQVGQTGKTVAPKLYLAFGISGAIQHLEGMRGADTIIAVNRDPNAAIFGVADLGVIGDLFEILPQLIGALEARAGRRAAVPAAS